jgi:16S rRNA (guanine527-N7)-methyltransferase
MTEDEAKAWLTNDWGVSRETFEKLSVLQSMVVAENEKQNLISAASIPSFWARHIVDSAQLLVHATPPGVADDQSRNWLDLGTGAGFPGLVIAIMRDAPITFVESRRKRIDFLVEAMEALKLPHVSIFGGRLELLEQERFSVISARAFAPLPKLLSLAHRFSTNETRWLLPKGRGAREEVEAAQADWSGVFHVEQSLTNAESAIIIARKVGKKGRV